MKAAVPVYVEEKREPGERPVFAARPLFMRWIARRAELVDRALARLAQDLRLRASQLSAQPRHDLLLQLVRAPVLSERVLKATLELRRGTEPFHALVVSYPWNGRKLAFTPSLPDLWFEVGPDAAVEDRAREVFQDHFRQLERADPHVAVRAAGTSGRAWIAWIELDVGRRRTRAEDEDPKKRAITSSRELDGDVELAATGTCLAWRDPDELDRAIGREAEMAELERLLHAQERRPVLLLGGRQAGKTALLHEYVRRAKKRPPGPTQRVLWQLSPERLISGMSYVGQWEQRLLAILKTAARKDLVLCFDDVIGLFSAGVCASSDLSVAHVLRARIEQRRVRVVAEMTPEAFRVLRERDRGFADLFHVIPVRQTTKDETLAILVTLMRDLEARHRGRFHVAAVPAVLDVSARHARDVAYPGKAASFLRQIAVKLGAVDIGRDQVYQEFAARSGMALDFLDGDRTVRRAEVKASLDGRLIGQPAALDAMIDTVLVARARLADPTRPLGSLLLLGPTGVGKTQCAKALAAYLFGDPTRMVRIDMNELAGPDSAERLVGTFHEPEGLLTAAVRQQPFCVVLLDEIEKAHPDVLDLLLQVLGDGRLTDGRGRTTDFGNAIVVMTSNLGAREVGQAAGFAGDARDAEQVYRRAAERFFRPELFNRIDQIVPFAKLSRESLVAIVRGLIDDVLARGGLAQRRCQMSVHPDAMERIVDAGFHPELGARALRRAVENVLTAPVADRLASLPPGAPTLIRIEPQGGGVRVETDVLAVRGARPWTPRTGRASSNIEALDDALARLDEQLAPFEPSGAIEAGAVSPAQLTYLAMRDQAQRAARLRDVLAGRAATRGGRAAPVRTAQRPLRRVSATAADWAAVLVAGDMRAALADLAARGRRYGDTLEDRVDELAGEVGLLALLVRAVRAGEPQGAKLRVRALAASPVRNANPDAAGWTLHAHLRDMFLELGSVVQIGWNDRMEELSIDGPGARSLARLVEGTYVTVVAGKGILCEVRVAGDEPADALAPIVSFYDDACTIDVATGLILPATPQAAELRRALIARLEAEVTA